MIFFRFDGIHSLVVWFISQQQQKEEEDDDEYLDGEFTCLASSYFLIHWSYFLHTVEMNVDVLEFVQR